MSERLPLRNDTLRELRRFTVRGHLQDWLSMLSRDYVVYNDDFLGDTIRAEWATTATSNATAAAISAGLHGRVNLVSGATDDGLSTLRMPSSTTTGDQDAIFSARLFLSSVANVKVEVGFSNDPTLTATGSIDNLDAGSDVPTLGAGITDAVVAIFDTDSTQDNWQFAGARASAAWRDATLGDAPASGVTHPTPAANSYQWITVALVRVDLATDDMNAYFYVDGALEASKNLGAVANATALYPYVLVQSRSAASRTLTLDAVRFRAVRDTSA